MPRHVPRERSYDVPFVGAGLATIELKPRQLDAIRRALRNEPSKEFLRAFGVTLSNYEGHRKAVRDSTPAAVQARIKAVVDAAHKLHRALAKLTLTDDLIFSSIWTRRFLQKQEPLPLSPHRFEAELPHFLTLATGALQRIEGERKSGAMPAFAQRGLACGVCQILFEETGKLPTAERNGAFDVLLRFGLDLVDDRERAAGQRERQKKRKDVEDLMREALRWLEQAIPAFEAMPSLKTLPRFSAEGLDRE